MAKFNLEIEQHRHNYQVKLWLWEEGNGEDIYYTINNEGDGLIANSVKSTDPILHDHLKPLIVLPRAIANVFIKLVAEHANSNGINTENESILKGKLDAKEEHLSDLRKIIFTTLNVKE